VRRRLVTLLLCLLVSTAALAPTQIAAAAPLKDCTSTSGTVVAVNYGHWGGPVVVGCGVKQSSGYNLLHAAGFTTAGDLHDGPAFICRLGDRAFRHGTQYPDPSQDACVVTPPSSAYWSYWLALAGQNRWSYSQLGAMADAPKPGEVELWTFGGTNIAGTRGSGLPTLTPNQVRVFVSTRDSADNPSVSTGRPRMIAAQLTSVSDASGSPVPTIVGICVGVLLAGAALVTVRRRRRVQ
jgi:MYXO-CTERM domain-containing protein